jgi:hypothetical protein
MKRWLLLFCFLIGCGKSHKIDSEVQTDGVAPPASSSKEAPDNLQNKNDPDGTDAMLKRLTQAVRRYGVEQQKAPANLEEVFARGYLKELPQPPNGKRFSIDKKLEVKLINR